MAPPAAPAPASAVTAPAPAAGPALGWQTGLTGIPLTLAANQQAMLAIASEQPQPDELRLSMRAGDAPATAYRTLGVTAAPGGQADVGTAMRALDRRLDGVTRRAGYRVQAAPARQLGDTEPVWVIASTDGAAATDRQVTARTAYVGERCDVLVDAAVGTALDERARALGAAFDGGIWDTDTRLFGEPRPVGARGTRVTIVVTPEVGNHGQDGTLGYFTARDLFSPADAPDEAFLQHSNQGAYLYMADRVVGRGEPVEYLGTLAHEFQHLISATHKLYGQAARQESLWLNEAMSMYAMAANGYGMPDGSRVIASHVSEYLSAPERYSLTRWDLNPSQSGYGVGYLFAVYLVERVGEGMLKELVTSPQTGLANLDARLAAHGTSFRQLFRDWVAATLLDGRGPGGIHEYRTLDLQGAYAGRQLSGVRLATVDLPNAGRVPVLPHSASFLLLRGAAGGSFSLDVAGRTADQLGAFLAPR
ncbi:Neutral metalloprotease precursor [compost metagenome]